jgi:type VI secretion system secreted protein VgrG
MSGSESASRGVDISIESQRFACDDMRVVRLSGTTAISRSYAIEVDVVCLDRHGIDASTVLGEDVTIVFTPHDLGDEPWEGVQRIHGMVARIEDRLAAHRDYRTYRFHVAPRFDRLSLSASQEIFLGMSVPDILKAKLDTAGLATGSDTSDVVLRLEGSYDPREFVVQYKETDRAFVSRLAEHLGIAFFFRHDGDFDQLVLTDQPAGFTTDAPQIPFRQTPELLAILELSTDQRMVPKTWTIHDYNYRKPQLALLTTEKVAPGYAGDVVEYTPHVKTPEAASALAKVRAQELAAAELVYSGKSNVPALSPGARIRVTDHPDLDTVDLLVVEVHHEATQTHGNAGAETNGARGYSNAFRAIPADRMYRPPRVTPRPTIAGLVNGVIDPGSGSSGQYAELDDQGRYRVRFLFDTSNRNGQYSSHPVRMLQNHAGENYGTHFPLKPGIEVMVGFVDGDPDRPVIVGAAANPLTPSPVVAGNAGLHRVKSITGTIIDFT